MSQSQTLDIDALLLSYDDVVPAVNKHLVAKAASMVLPLPDCPDGLIDYIEYAENGDPIPPEDLTKLDLVSVGKLYSYIAGYTNYVQGLATEAWADLLIAKRKLKILQVGIPKVLREENPDMGIQVSKDEMLLQPGYIEIDAHIAQLEIINRVLNARYEELKRSCNGISREQTRRQEEGNRQRHEDAGGGTAGPRRTTPMRRPAGRGRTPRRKK